MYCTILQYYKNQAILKALQNMNNIDVYNVSAGI